jgi:SAM-dependent methyltransferase
VFNTVEQRSALWPPAVPLSANHIRNCRLVENRDEMLAYMPKNGVCAELGILAGDFSEKILKTTLPKKLHLIDLDSAAVTRAEKRFASEISKGIVQVHHGDSANMLLSMPDHYFDWVYIDADHHYESVKRDLESARSKLKDRGMIALNDYTFFSPLELQKYGVVEAVNEFCVQYGFEVLYFALQGRMYNDVVIRPME